MACARHLYAVGRPDESGRPCKPNVKAERKSVELLDRGVEDAAAARAGDGGLAHPRPLLLANGQADPAALADALANLRHGDPATGGAQSVVQAQVLSFDVGPRGVSSFLQ